MKEGFIRPANADIVVEAKEVDEVVEKLLKYQLPDTRYHLDWTVQSPLEQNKKLVNGDLEQT